VRKCLVLGDDSLSVLPNAHLENLNLSKLVYEAKHFFGFSLNKDKVNITSENNKIKFLGYTA
jgi:hypothetical protein